MAGKRRLNICPECNGRTTVEKRVQRVLRREGGKQQVITETVDVDCPTCDGSGRVVDFDG